MANQREHSKQNWLSSGTVEEINSGCLQRIADATEAIAKNYNSLLNQVEALKRDVNYYRDDRDRKDRKISALRGVITKLKKKQK